MVVNAASRESGTRHYIVETDFFPRCCSRMPTIEAQRAGTVVRAGHKEGFAGLSRIPNSRVRSRGRIEYRQKM